MKLDDQVNSGIILVVDDQQINRLISRQLLIELGFNVVLANNGKEALDILERSPVDLILMDLYMPVMDGIETAIKIRADNRFNELPIVALTADDKQDQRIRCLNAGMNDVIAKPLQSEVIISVVSRLLPAAPLTHVNSSSGERHWPDTPGINVPIALERLNGKTELYFKMLDKFQQQYAEAAIALRWMLDTGDVQSAIRFLHSISGAAAHLGASTIQTQAAALETLLREQPGREVEFALFESSMNEAMETINQLLSAND
ncbi:response regulator [Cohnella kolymensis]|uniref:response regulator n=1 Tax=Cohnella kolymensis TaxID=1590652 RepID=UPI001F2C40F7|nr:response regulator [Cohnella kolymensis]